MILLVVVLLVVCLLVVFTLYNSLVKAKNSVREAWSGIDVQLKRRTDLIPNLVEMVKTYAMHEKEVLESVSEARARLLQATGPNDLAIANDRLAKTIKTLFAVAENYPKLKASNNFLDLQKQLTDTEDSIAYSRQYYNASVQQYNTMIKTFPTIIVATVFGFHDAEFFKVTVE